MPTSPPNLIFLMPDQLRHDFLSCYGADFIDTPHIDRMAAEGIRYDRAYSTHPVCVPARAALLTGMNAIRNGVTDNGQWLRPDYRQMGIRTWPELLGEAGYYTAAVGKMHFYPWDITHGFQYRVAVEDKRWIHVRDEYFHYLQERGLRKLHGNEHAGYFENKGAIIHRVPLEHSWDVFTGQQACHFLRLYGNDGPFALMVGFPGPHCPYDPSPETPAFDPEKMPDPIPAGSTPPAIKAGNVHGNRQPWNGVDYSEFTHTQKLKVRAHYAGLVKQIDDQIGALFQTLEEQGLLENTVAIFASDHGDYLGDHDLIGKSTFYEASCHVPMLLRPAGGAAQPAVRDELVQLTDVTATLLHLAGVERPAYMDSQPLPGVGAAGSPREHLFGMVSNGWMIYDGRWKLCKYGTGDIQLFDRQNDPDEQQNLAADPAQHAKLLELDALLTQEIMRSVTSSHADKRVYSSTSLSGDPAFGRRGWQRQYPQSVVSEQ